VFADLRRNTGDKLLEVPLGEGSARAGFEVAFEIVRLRLISEKDRCFDSPGTISGRGFAFA